MTPIMSRTSTVMIAIVINRLVAILQGEEESVSFRWLDLHRNKGLARRSHLRAIPLNVLTLRST